MNEEIEMAAVDAVLGELKERFTENGKNAADIVMLPVAELFPHPENPRKDVGDVTELAASIAASGVRQNLTVVRGHEWTDEEYREADKKYREKPSEELRTQINKHHSDDGYTVIIGHRRLAACKAAGVTEVPCIITEMDRKAQIATMLEENMQRVDLTIQEQAQSMQMMMDLGDTVEDLSGRTGLSKATVKHRLEVAKLDRAKLADRQITMAEMIDLERVKSIDTRNSLLQYVGTRDFEFKVNGAVRAELTAANRKIVLKKFPTLPKGKWWSDKQYSDNRFSNKYDYSRYYYSQYDAGKDAFIAESDGSVVENLSDIIALVNDPKYTFYDEGTMLYVFSKVEKKEPEKPKKTAIEEARERAIHDLIEAWKVVQTTRFNYMLSHTPDKKEREQLADLLCDKTADGNAYIYGCSQMESVLGIEKRTSFRQIVDEHLKDKWKPGTKEMWILAALMLNCTTWDWEGKYTPDRETFTDKKIEKMRKFLGMIGYEMGADEDAMMNGSSPLYLV